MQNRFAEILSFLRIVEAGSLSEAARRLDLSLAAISRRLTRLENRLGVPLIRRNSRHLSLTDEGLLFYDKARRILADMDEAEAAVMRTATDAAGPLRVVTTIGFGRRRLAPLLHRYAQLHPEVQLHLETTDQAASIVESGHDIGICFDPPPDSALTRKKLADNPRILCAAPSYLERRGQPRHAADLAGHDAILVDGGNRDLWHSLCRDEGVGEPGRTLSTNDAELARIWALNGAGIALKSQWDVAEDIDAGRLRPVLPGLALPASPVVALYLPAQGETAKVRSCLRFLARHLVPEAAPAHSAAHPC